MSHAGPLLPGGGHHHRFDPAPYKRDEALATGLLPRPNLMAGSEIEEATRRIAESYRAMKRDQASLQAPWLPAGEWASYPGGQDPLYAALADNNIAEAAVRLSDFWRNGLGPIVKEYAGFVDLAAGNPEPTARFSHNVIRNWLIWRMLTGAPTEALASPAVGNTWGYEIEGTIVAPKATRYHLMARELSGMLAGLERPVVAEIGGGYGGLAEFFLRQNPQAVWLDYDLPETAVIAAFFHIGARGGAKVRLYGESTTPETAAMPETGRTYILPNYAIRALAPLSVDATVNMFSLSEIGPGPLAAYLERIAAITRSWFVHHNMDRTGVINRGHERIPASNFVIDPKALALVSTGFDPFHGLDGDYRWYLYRRPFAS